MFKQIRPKIDPILKPSEHVMHHNKHFLYHKPLRAYIIFFARAATYSKLTTHFPKFSIVFKPLNPYLLAQKRSKVSNCLFWQKPTDWFKCKKIAEKLFSSCTYFFLLFRRYFYHITKECNSVSKIWSLAFCSSKTSSKYTLVC